MGSQMIFIPGSSDRMQEVMLSITCRFSISPTFTTSNLCLRQSTSTCFRMSLSLIHFTPSNSLSFWKVIALTTPKPYTLFASKVFISASTPAPALGSCPAMLKTYGRNFFICVQYSLSIFQPGLCDERTGGLVPEYFSRGHSHLA